jgi:DNA-binding MarR family transcriptional regulator
MEKAGFVERRADVEDERVSRVYLTDAGREVKAAADEVWHAYAEQAFTEFSEAELMQFYTLLQRLYQSLGGDESK